MPEYLIESNYGTFQISKRVFADSGGMALDECGVMMTLIAAGWIFDTSPEGEEHQATLIPTVEVSNEQRIVLADICNIMDEGTDGNGWDVGIMDSIDRYLRDRGFETINCADL